MPERQSEGFFLKFRRIITLLIIFTTPTVVQAGADTDFQTWSDITTIYKLSDRWQYIGDQGIRGVLSDSDFTTLYFRPSVRYLVKPWFTVKGGVRFYRTWNEDDPDTFEIGPWQGLLFTWPEIGDYAITHYLRLEERMIWQTSGERDFDFTLRGRYRLGLRSPNFDILFKNGVFLTGSIEAFANLESPIFVNRIRYDVGVGTKVSDAWRVQLHYMIHQDRSSPGAAFSVDEHILRLRLFYTFN